jgi:hypothetical protein
MARVANASFLLYRENKQRWVYLRKSACSSDSTTNQQSHLSSVRLKRLRVRELSPVVHNDFNDIPEEMARSTSPHSDIVITYLNPCLSSPEEQGEGDGDYTSRISCNAQATEYHLGLLKAKLAKYRAQLLEPVGKSSGGGTGFDVQKAGGARTVA